MKFPLLTSLFAIFSITLSVATVSSPARASNLWEIYEMALANDPSYRAAYLDHEANLFNLPLAEAAFKPTIGASAQLGKDYTDISGSTETRDDNGANLNLNLPLFDRSDRIQIKQSRYQEQVSAFRLKQAEQNLILRVAERYFNLLAGQDALDVARLERISIKRQMDLASERLEVGLGTRTDLYDAQARFKLSESDEIQAQNKINNDIALLKQIIGTTPEALTPLSESAPLELPSPNDVDEWISLSQKGNLSLNIQSLTKDIALEEIDKQRRARSPQLSVDGNYRWADTDTNFNGSSGSYNSASVALQLKIPLYLAGTTHLRTEQAGYQYNQSESLLEEARRAASADATSAFLDISSGVSQVEALFDAIRAGESALEAKEEGFNAGLTTNLDVLDAQRDLSQSKTDYLRARYTYILSVLQLESATGDLNDNDVKRVNNWLAN